MSTQIEIDKETFEAYSPADLKVIIEYAQAKQEKTSHNYWYEVELMCNDRLAALIDQTFIF